MRKLLSPAPLRGLLALCAAGMLAWAVAGSEVHSDIGSFLELRGQVTGPANSPTLNSTLDLSGGDTVRWTSYLNSRLVSPYEANGELLLPSGHTWVSGSVRKPAGTTMQWQVNGNWVEVEPAAGAAVTAVKWAFSTRFKGSTGTVNKAVNFSGTGDGYRIIPYKDGLFVVNHHDGGAPLKCRSALDGQTCKNWQANGYAFSGAAGTALTSSNTSSYYTSDVPLESLNYRTGELFVGLGTPNSPEIVCTNLDTITSCGSWSVGDGSAKGIMVITNLVSIGNLYYVIVAGDKLVCFDTDKRALCGSTHYPGAFHHYGGATSSVALDGKLLFSNNKGKAYCHDPAIGGPCAGWSSSGAEIGAGGIFPYLNRDGSARGVCTAVGGCVDMRANKFAFSTPYANFIQDYGLYMAVHGYPYHNMSGILGTKVYGAADHAAACFDFAKDAECGYWPAPSSLQPYSTLIDPTRPNCLMILGNAAQAMIFDVTTGGECTSGVPSTLPDFVFNPLEDYFQCDSTRARINAWRLLRLSPSLPWGGDKGLSKVIVTLKDGNGTKLPDALRPVRELAYGTYQLDVSDIPYSRYPVLKVGIELQSPSLLPATAVFGIDLTYDGDPIQVCVSTKAPNSPDCNSGTFLTVQTRRIDALDGVPEETLKVSTLLSPGGLSSGYSAVATPTSPRAVLSDLGARDPKTYVVQGRWALQHFSGDLWAFGLGANGQIDGSSYLSAQAATAAPSARPMFAATPGAGVQPVKSLDWSLLSDGQRQALNLDLGGVADTKGSARLDYLRGTDGSFRARSGKSLGPVISSSPAMLLPAATMSLDERSHPGYTAYRATVTRPHPIALFGGNDGALHAYEVRPGSLKEAWSFVPDAMLRRAANYADASLAGIRANPYFVDNIPMVGHANTTGQPDGWRAVAVVTYGRGARAITALDVTRSDLSQGDGVLFEYSNTSDPELKDLGYIISQPVSNNAMVSQQIVQLGKDSERRAAVLVGNGINSNDGDGGAAASGTGKAVLYAFYLDRGERRWQRWAVDELWAGADSEPGLKTNNGLSTPTPVDVDGDGRVDLVYAGDLQGNLWRFDIRDPAAARVTRLFKTALQQPITQAPFVSVNTQATGCGSTEANAATSAKRCWQVVFSTGADISPLLGSPNVSTQSIYGVLDKGRGASLERGHLTAIPFEVNTLLNGVEYRALKPTTVNYKDKQGWYIDLQAFEHGVGAPRQQPTGLVMFSSIRPTTPERAINVCIGPRSWLNEVDPINGYSALVPFDTNGDGNIDGLDRINPDSNSPLSPAGMAVSGAQFGPPAILLAASTQAQQMSLLLPSLGQDTGQVNSWSGGVPPGGSATPGQNSTALTHANKAKLGRMTWREVY